MIQHLIFEVDVLKEVAALELRSKNKLEEKLDVMGVEIIWMRDQFNVLSRDVIAIWVDMTYLKVEMMQCLISEMNVLKEVANTRIEKQNKHEEELDTMMEVDDKISGDQFNFLSKGVAKIWANMTILKDFEVKMNDIEGEIIVFSRNSKNFMKTLKT
ncbi:hypothetical protein V6N13_026584 [Hibiscus sabdariffa]|uniref:Uncharacterized protein n=1 Tax=Hibiscus sabdariffa TaxID=183260 RepID=A0ABR2PEK7_9ROSI